MNILTRWWIRGETGVQGTQGDTGIQGETGVQGTQGVTGIQVGFNKYVQCCSCKRQGIYFDGESIYCPYCDAAYFENKIRCENKIDNKGEQGLSRYDILKATI